MYTILLDNHILHSANVDGLKVFSPKIVLEQNKISTFTFVLYPTNQYYSQIDRLKSLVKVIHGNDIVFNGRVVETTVSTNKSLEVYCESDEAYFCDTIQNPFEYNGTVSGLLQQFINNHNTQVASDKQFTLGNVTVEDDNDYIVRSNSEYSTTWQAINSKLLDSGMGGYLVIRHENNVAYVDYLADFTTLNSQHVVFGENMQSIQFNDDFSGLASVLIPLGALDENGNRLTIASVNGGVKYLENATAISNYGRIVQTKVWDNINVASRLKTKGLTYLSELASPNTSIEVSAIDLANVNQNINNFKMYSKIKITSAFHNIDEYFVPNKMTIDLFNQKNNKIVLNGVRKTLTEDDRGLSGIVETLENISTNAHVNIPQKIAEVRQELTSLIQQTSTTIRTEIRQAYYAKDDNTDLISVINTQFTQSAQAFEFRFNQFQQELEYLVDDTNANFQDIRRYIRFIDGNIILGEEGNEFSLKITNTRISFLQGQVEVAYVSNSKLYISYAEILSSLTLGDFGFVHRQSGNLSFKKVSG